MKKVSLLMLFIALASLGYAQTEKSTWLIGGNFNPDFYEKASDSYATSNLNISLQTRTGYFLADKWVLGINLRAKYSHSKTNDGPADSSEYAIGPFSRYYLGNRNFKFFPEASFNIGLLNGSTSGAGSGMTTKGNFYSCSLGIGAAYFLNKNIALEFLIPYTFTDYKLESKADVPDWVGGNFVYKNNYTENKLGLLIGFQIYL